MVPKLQLERATAPFLIHLRMHTRGKKIELKMLNRLRVFEQESGTPTTLWRDIFAEEIRTWDLRPTLVYHSANIHNDVFLIDDLHLVTWSHRALFPLWLVHTHRLMVYMGDAHWYALKALSPPPAKSRRFLGPVFLRVPPCTKEYILLLDRPWRDMCMEELQIRDEPPISHQEADGTLWGASLCRQVKGLLVPSYEITVKFATRRETSV